MLTTSVLRRQKRKKFRGLDKLHESHIDRMNAPVEIIRGPDDKIAGACIRQRGRSSDGGLGVADDSLRGIESVLSSLNILGTASSNAITAARTRAPVNQTIRGEFNMAGPTKFSLSRRSF